MTGADYIVDLLIKSGATDGFGIPGGVILDLLYAMDKRREEFAPHLSFNEQCAGFAAVGYAQISGRLGVAYATRGPGFTNLISAIADAYYDSIPALFITGHSTSKLDSNVRILADQEMDTVHMVSHITKYAKRIDTVDSLKKEVPKAITLAIDGRKGPVFLDLSSSVLRENMDCTTIENGDYIAEKHSPISNIDYVIDTINNSKRPVLLLGDGIHQGHIENEINELITKIRIPTLSSRFSHDIVNDSSIYFGYVGSHATRYANFVLSKADLIISLGNRLNFPFSSQSYKNVIDKAKFIRVDIDRSEFQRNIPDCINYNVDARDFISALLNANRKITIDRKWLKTCQRIKETLINSDINAGAELLSNILNNIPSDWPIICDVGNNEFWLSRSAVYSNIKNRVLYSKSFGALGCSLGKAIGAFYATRKSIIVVVGDQGLQLNIQELEYISKNNIPIYVLLINNQASGMIRDREIPKYGYAVHTTLESGFGNPNYKKICEAYNIQYIKYNDASSISISLSRPTLIEIMVNDNFGLTPSLPKGNACQDLYPLLERELYNELNKL